MEPVDLAAEGVILRAPVHGDAEAIHAACQDTAIQRWVPIPVPYSRDDALAYVETAGRNWTSGTSCTWLLVDGETVAGALGIDHIADGRATIGYWMAPASRGRGLLTRAAQTVIDFAFAAPPAGLGLQRLEWHAYGGNVPSARAAARLGFRFEGVLRLGAIGRTGREDDWVAGLLATDDRSPQAWPVG